MGRVVTKKKVILLVCLWVAISFLIVSVQAQPDGVPKRRPKPNEYGNLKIDNASTLKGVSPVIFMHWLHRSKYTCRLCHIDIGFAMEAGMTGITCDDIKNGLYCGACHNGGESFALIEKKFGEPEIKNCDRCHSLGKVVTFKYNFYEFRKGLPRERFGNGIDWIKAEEKGLIVLKDYLEGVSIKKKKIKDPEAMSLSAQNEAMPNIIFSHEKHAIWSGCELCHPEMFGVTSGSTVYSMEDIFNGKYCGVCHGKVAFANNDCQRCHTDEV